MQKTLNITRLVFSVAFRNSSCGSQERGKEQGHQRIIRNEGDGKGRKERCMEERSENTEPLKIVAVRVKSKKNGPWLSYASPQSLSGVRGMTYIKECLVVYVIGSRGFGARIKK